MESAPEPQPRVRLSLAHIALAVILLAPLVASWFWGIRDWLGYTFAAAYAYVAIKVFVHVVWRRDWH